MSATTKTCACEKCGKYPAILDVEFYPELRNDEQQSKGKTIAVLAICQKCFVKIARRL
jgi:hypothetical protein